MRPKRLDIFILKSFLLLFVAAFAICLFILLMNVVWRYAEDLVGKGLDFITLASFFWEFALTLVPQALPLAVLMASLITFGNFGERLELLAMKTSGIPLLRLFLLPECDRSSCCKEPLCTHILNKREESRTGDTRRRFLYSDQRIQHVCEA